jgi:1,4-dihydroxy-2-naphthoyl-CoA synthase
MTDPVVRLEVDGPVATITLNRPASRNAISGELLARLGGAMAAADAGDDARAVRALLASYRQTEADVVGGGYAVEERTARAWRQSSLDLAETARRRAAVTERGRAQAGPRGALATGAAACGARRPR